MTRNDFSRPFLWILAASTAFSATTATAEDRWNGLQPTELYPTVQIHSEFVVSSGFIGDFDLIAFDEADRDDATGSSPIGDSILPRGWQGLIEVDMDEEETISVSYVPGHADRLKTSTSETRMSGFYTMRYSFESDSEIRPYAGAGVGIVATEDGSRLAGGLAARAVAGFDIEVDDNAGFYAEYSFLKSSGTMLAQADAGAGNSALPDDEHSITFGFRRTF